MNCFLNILLKRKGSLRNLYDSWREALIKCLAHVEAVIDFAEDEHLDADVLTNGSCWAECVLC